LLYDSFFAGKRAEEPQVPGAQSGGLVSRGGKEQTGVTRELRQQASSQPKKKKRALVKVTSPMTNPGRDINIDGDGDGKDPIYEDKSLVTKFEGISQRVKSVDIMSKIFTSLFASTIDMMLGQGYKKSLPDDVSKAFAAEFQEETDMPVSEKFVRFLTYELDKSLKDTQQKIFAGLTGQSTKEKDVKVQQEQESGSGDTTTTTSISGKSGTIEQQAMLKAISFAEGTTSSYGTIYGGKVVPELARGELTINQVLEMQRTGMLNGKSVGYAKDGYDSDATGRYQFMSYTLREEMQKQNIPGTALFTPALQDQMILRRIARFRKVTPELLRKEGMSDKVIDMLAPEFASFPNLFGPDAKGRVGTNTSYYGQGGKSAESIKKVYNESLQLIQSKPSSQLIQPEQPSSQLIQPEQPSSQIKTNRRGRKIGDQAFLPVKSLPNLQQDTTYSTSGIRIHEKNTVILQKEIVIG